MCWKFFFLTDCFILSFCRSQYKRPCWKHSIARCSGTQFSRCSWLFTTEVNYIYVIIFNSSYFNPDSITHLIFTLQFPSSLQRFILLNFFTNQSYENEWYIELVKVQVNKLWLSSQHALSRSDECMKKMEYFTSFLLILSNTNKILFFSTIKPVKWIYIYQIHCPVINLLLHHSTVASTPGSSMTRSRHQFIWSRNWTRSTCLRLWQNIRTESTFNKAENTVEQLCTWQPFMITKSVREFWQVHGNAGLAHCYNYCVCFQARTKIIASVLGTGMKMIQLFYLKWLSH